jgi:hypothetical protein
MNKNIVLLEQLYEKRNNAYVKKEIALDNWDYDNEFLDDMTNGYVDGRHMDLYNYYIAEKDKYELLNNMYRVKYKNIINIVMKYLPVDCIDYLNKYI